LVFELNGCVFYSYTAFAACSFSSDLYELCISSYSRNYRCPFSFETVRDHQRRVGRVKIRHCQDLSNRAIPFPVHCSDSSWSSISDNGCQEAVGSSHCRDETVRNLAPLSRCWRGVASMKNCVYPVVLAGELEIPCHSTFAGNTRSNTWCVSVLTTS